VHRVSDLVCSGLLQWGPEPQAGKVGPRSWIDVQCWARQGIRVGPFSHPHPFTFSGKSPHCLIPIKKTCSGLGISLGALSEKSWIPKLDRCAMLGEAEDLGWSLFPPPPIHLLKQEPTLSQLHKKHCSGVGIPLGALSAKT
jgi:hypothetical protein